MHHGCSGAFIVDRIDIHGSNNCDLNGLPLSLMINAHRAERNMSQICITQVKSELGLVGAREKGRHRDLSRHL
jgi:hypothetical protein